MNFYYLPGASGLRLIIKEITARISFLNKISVCYLEIYEHIIFFFYLNWRWYWLWLCV